MSLHDDLQKKLNAEQMQQLDDLLGDDFDWDLVPRSRLNKVIAQRNDLRKQVGNPTLKPQKATGKEDDDEDGDGSGETYTKAELDALLKAEQDKAAAEVNAFKIKQATLSKLQAEKALDPELVYGLLDSTKLSLNDKGELKGLEEAGLKGIQESKKFLFGASEPDVPAGTGKDGAGSGKKDALDSALEDVFAGYTFIEESK